MKLKATNKKQHNKTRVLSGTGLDNSSSYATRHVELQRGSPALAEGAANYKASGSR